MADKADLSIAWRVEGLKDLKKAREYVDKARHHPGKAAWADEFDILLDEHEAIIREYVPHEFTTRTARHLENTAMTSGLPARSQQGSQMMPTTITKSTPARKLFDVRAALYQAADSRGLDRNKLAAETIPILQRYVAELRKKQEHGFDEEVALDIFVIGLMLRQLRN